MPESINSILFKAGEQIAKQLKNENLNCEDIYDFVYDQLSPSDIVFHVVTKELGFSEEEVEVAIESNQ